MNTIESRDKNIECLIFRLIPLSALTQYWLTLPLKIELTPNIMKVQKPSDDAILSNDTVTVTVEIGPIDTDN